MVDLGSGRRGRRQKALKYAMRPSPLQASLRGFSA
jgi:hypothetical protein